MKNYEHIFDLNAMEEPIGEFVKNSGYTGEKEEAVEFLKGLILSDLKERQEKRIQKNRMSQERSFHIEGCGFEAYGMIQFLLIQTGSLNIFQAIGWIMSIEYNGYEGKYKVWKYCDYSPKALVYWNGERVKVTLNESASG